VPASPGSLVRIVPKDSRNPQAIARLARRVATVVPLFVLAVVLVRGSVALGVSYLWFSANGFGEVFGKVFFTRLLLFLLFGVFGFGFSAASFGLAFSWGQREFTVRPLTPFLARLKELLLTRPRVSLLAGAGLLGLWLGAEAQGKWMEWLMLVNSTPFGRTDGTVGVDASYLVFELPFYAWLLPSLFVLICAVGVVVAFLYFLLGGMSVARAYVSARARAHVLSLVIALVLVKGAAYYYVSRPSVDLSDRGVVTGANYTDVHVQLPAFELLVAVCLVVAGLSLIGILRRSLLPPAVGVVGWSLVALVAGAVFPAALQRFYVVPAQSRVELPYIAKNIKATRFAFGLEHVEVVSFAAGALSSPPPPSAGGVASQVRVWDREFTASTFQKLQDVKNYYQIEDLSYDRYEVEGRLVPVVIGVRVLNQSNLPAQGWVNTHLQYTHGYGVVVALAQTADPDGNPTFVIKDVPQSTAPGWPVLARPQIYSFPGASGYVIVRTRQAEFDHPLSSGGAAYADYRGTGGVGVGDVFRRVLYALYFKDVNVLTSSLIGPRSEILYWLDARERIRKVAPFLSLDSDPYPVIADGRLYFVFDAYTTTDYYPYAERFDANEPSGLSPLTGLPSTFNYVRNAVKAVVDAYSGKVTLYVNDPEDPILRTWEKAFPSLFVAKSRMPKALKAHLRYPADLFAVQAALFGRYHLVEPSDFYSASNAWTISQAPPPTPEGEQLTSAAYPPIDPNGRFSPEYEVAQFPGQGSPTFELVEPLVPAASSGGPRQQVLSAVMVAGCDGADYGKLWAYSVRSESPVSGPALVGSLIDSDAGVSQAITLLSQRGSRVILGTVMIVPISSALVYFRPIFVEAAVNPVPNVKYVVAVSGDHIVLAPSAVEGLADLVGATGVQPAPGPTSSRIASLVSQAVQLYQKAQEDLRAGRLGEYQADVDAIGQLLARIQGMVGGSPAPNPGPSSANST
jgi:uncharacterized membrane protein (UPF0182 family)